MQLLRPGPSLRASVRVSVRLTVRGGVRLRVWGWRGQGRPWCVLLVVLGFACWGVGEFSVPVFALGFGSVFASGGGRVCPRRVVRGLWVVTRDVSCVVGSAGVRPRLPCGVGSAGIFRFGFASRLPTRVALRGRQSAAPHMPLPSYGEFPPLRLLRLPPPPCGRSLRSRGCAPCGACVLRTFLPRRGSRPHLAWVKIASCAGGELRVLASG